MVLIPKSPMRFLVIGLGSAGQRHARVIRSLFPSATIDAYIGAHHTGLIAEDLKSVDYTVTPMDFYGLNQVKALDGIRDKYDLTVIATPINSHFEYFDKTKEISSTHCLSRIQPATILMKLVMVSVFFCRDSKIPFRSNG